LRGAARLRLVADARAAEKFRAELTGDFTVADVTPPFLAEELSRLSREGEARGPPPWWWPRVQGRQPGRIQLG
jgi:hypothetical protein